jgi:transcriptional antiterminator NusG
MAETSDKNGQEALWYVIHTYSGYEKRVKATLEMIIENRGLQDMIQEVLIPVETVLEIKDGKRRTFERKIYPGYVLVKMILTDDIWYIVRNTSGRRKPHNRKMEIKAAYR